MKTILPSSRARETVSGDRVTTSLSRRRRNIESRLKGDAAGRAGDSDSSARSGRRSPVGTLVADDARVDGATATKQLTEFPGPGGLPPGPFSRLSCRQAV